MTFDPQDLATSLVDHGTDWAEKNAAAELLEETRKTLRSQIALGFMPTAGSVSKAEMMSEATEEYNGHIRQMVEARKQANRARVQYDSTRAFVELVRSQESTRREEMRMR